MLETFIIVAMIVWVARAISRRARGRRNRLSASFNHARAHKAPLS